LTLLNNDKNQYTEKETDKKKHNRPNSSKEGKDKDDKKDEDGKRKRVSVTTPLAKY
jgi:hypothetical protein